MDTANIDTLPILEIKNFQKDFRSYWTFMPKTIVKNLNISVNHGEAFGFLGHNGAGKTTTIKSILGLLKITSGEILINGKADFSREDIGYLPEQPYFYDHLTVRETLEFFAELLGLNDRSRIEEVMHDLELKDREHQKVRALSKGWQQRLGVAQAILNKPKLLILDEPFSGLDPLARRTIRELIFKLKHEGATIFMTSHILSDVSEICDRVAIMTKGELVTLLNLKEWSRTAIRSYELSIEEASEVSWQKLEKFSISTAESKRRGQISFNDYDSAKEALSYCLENGIKVLNFESKAPSLEEVFIQITEKGR